MTMGRMKDYKGKEGRLPKDERKSTKARKEDDYGRDEILPMKGRKSTIGKKSSKEKKEDDNEKDERLQREER